jgi:hypothetical protein
MLLEPGRLNFSRCGQRRIVSTAKTNEAKTDEVQETYQAPQVLPIGKATDLLQGATGKHTDGSTGYYWDQEG